MDRSVGYFYDDETAMLCGLLARVCVRVLGLALARVFVLFDQWACNMIQSSKPIIASFTNITRILTGFDWDDGLGAVRFDCINAVVRTSKATVKKKQYT